MKTPTKSPAKGPAKVKVTVKKAVPAPAPKTPAKKDPTPAPTGMGTLIQLARVLATLQKDQDDFDARAKALEPKIDQTMDEIVRGMNDLGLKNFTVDKLGQVQQYPWFSPKVLNKDAMLDWFRSHDTGKELVREDVPYQTMKSFFKELMDKGQTLPPKEVVDVLSFSKHKVKIVKGRG